MTKSWYRFDYLATGADRLVMRNAEASTDHRSDTGVVQPSQPPEISAMYGLVRASKGTAAYNAHSYPTKVPPEAITPFLEHFTRPGDTVLDPFCGSGMTGLAALRCGRVPILNDLSSLAVHLAYNHTSPCDPNALVDTWNNLRAALRAQERRHYSVRCDGCRRSATLRYTIWSDVYECPRCHAHANYWDNATQRERGRGTKVLRCKECNYRWPKSAATRHRSEPTWVTFACSCSSSLRSRPLTERERAARAKFNEPPSHLFVPRQIVDATREMYQRSALHLRDIQRVRDFYTPRNLSALAYIWHSIRGVQDRRVRAALAFAFTNTAWHGTRMRRYNERGGQRPLTGTLYIPQLSSEANVFDVFDHKIRQLARFYHSRLAHAGIGACCITRASAARLDWLANESIDYVFTDPPFGSNIFYADCNLIAEAWLGTLTEVDQEAVVNRSRGPSQGGKSLRDYEALLESAFREMHRVLRPGRWATIVFQSSDGAVWRSIEIAAERAGFSIHAADMLDKGQQSMKGYKGRRGNEDVASYDIVMHLRKGVSCDTNRLRSLTSEERRDVVTRAIAQHLRGLEPDDLVARTLPFLYSLGVRALLNTGSSVDGFSMQWLRETLSRELYGERDGRWFAPGDTARPVEGTGVEGGAESSEWQEDRSENNHMSLTIAAG